MASLGVIGPTERRVRPLDPTCPTRTLGGSLRRGSRAAQTDWSSTDAMRIMHKRSSTIQLQAATRQYGDRTILPRLLPGSSRNVQYPSEVPERGSNKGN